MVKHFNVIMKKPDKVSSHKYEFHKDLDLVTSADSYKKIRIFNINALLPNYIWTCLVKNGRVGGLIIGIGALNRTIFYFILI